MRQLAFRGHQDRSESTTVVYKGLAYSYTDTSFHVKPITHSYIHITYSGIFLVVAIAHWQWFG